MKIKKICIVGYGSHVKNTIIPSLNIQTKNIKIITKKIIDEFETFSSIHVALKELSKDYIFFNSTPPKFHYSISRLILSSGFNVIVEGFVNTEKGILIQTKPHEFDPNDFTHLADTNIIGGIINTTE